MKPARKIRFWLSGLFSKGKFNADLEAEIQLHLELRIEKKIAGGLDPEEARYAAIREFGGVDQIKERVRDQQDALWIDRLLRCVCHSVRSLRKRPAYAVTALATYAICLAANLAIFAAVDAILLRPLPVADPGRLVSIMNSYPRAGQPRAPNSIANYFDRRGAMPAFTSLSLYKETGVVVGTAEAASRMDIAEVSFDFFSTLGVPLAKGRSFAEGEMIRGADNVAVISDGFWHSYFDADPNVIGRSFLNNGIATTVIGILPGNFYFPGSRAVFYRPIPYGPFGKNPWMRHTANGGPMVARLAPGVTLSVAQAQMDAFNAAQMGSDPIAPTIKDSGYCTIVRGLRDDLVKEIRPTLVILACAVGCLLLIGSVNLINLLLIQASGRTREIAVRKALGAGRSDMVMSALAETAVLVVGGEVMGLVLGSWGVQLLRLLGSGQLPLGDHIAFDYRMAAVSAVISFVVWLLLSTTLIWFHLRSDLAIGLQSESFGGTAHRRIGQLRNLFIVAQVAFAFVLLAGAGRLSRSLKHVLDTPAGFRTNNILTASISLPDERYPDNSAHLRFVERLIPAIEASPGVERCAICSGTPFTRIIPQGVISVEGITPKAGEALSLHYLAAATSDYWPIMGIRLASGRLLGPADEGNHPVACVVDQSFADRYWPGRDPLGKHLSLGLSFDKANAVTVVGVVGDVKVHNLMEPSGTGLVYFPYSFLPHPVFSLVLQTSLPSSALVATLQRAIRQLDPDLPLADLRPLQSRYEESLISRRSPAIIAVLFASIALVLAAIGTFGVLSYAVTQRRREIGVRMALGAQPNQIRGQFIVIGVRLVALGSAIGLFAAWVSGRAMQGVLVGVSPLDGLSLSVTAVTLGIIAIPACILPALRAAQVDPASVLRAE